MAQPMNRRRRRSSSGSSSIFVRQQNGKELFVPNNSSVCSTESDWMNDAGGSLKCAFSPSIHSPSTTTHPHMHSNLVFMSRSSRSFSHSVPPPGWWWSVRVYNMFNDASHRSHRSHRSWTGLLLFSVASSSVITQINRGQDVGVVAKEMSWRLSSIEPNHTQKTRAGNTYLIIIIIIVEWQEEWDYYCIIAVVVVIVKVKVQPLFVLFMCVAWEWIKWRRRRKVL